MKRDIHRLPDGELEVMQVIWDSQPPVKRGDIERALSTSHVPATTTVLTFLTRLADKGFLSIEKKGRVNVYTPLVSRHDYLSAQSHRFVQRLCGGSMSAFAAALCDSGLSKEDLAELRSLLEKGTL